MYRYLINISSIILFFGTLALGSCEMRDTDARAKKVQLAGKKQQQNRNVTFLRRQFRGCKAHR